MSRYPSPIVLMYHGTPKETPISRYSLQARLFKKHIQYFKKNGWHTALFRDLLDIKSLPEKTVILTFDDGYLDNYLGAYLPLLENQMKATWFIATKHISNSANWLPFRSPQNDLLSHEQILDMHRNQMEIGSHTCSHRELPSLHLNAQIDELIHSKKLLETLTNSSVTSLAYPFGRYNTDSLIAAREAGYNLACTTQPGWLHLEPNPLLIRRITIFSGDDDKILARKLSFADNDVSWPKVMRYYSDRLLDRLGLVKSE